MINAAVTGPEAGRVDGDVPTHGTVASPLGELTLVLRSGDLVGLYYRHHRPAPSPARMGDQSTEGFGLWEKQLGEYLSGARQGFDLPHQPGGDGHDRKVWGVVAEIPYGETATYGQVARRLGDGTTAQEVGAALARNPLCIVVPCHRVVGADGRLTGYAGGLGRKQFLLELEAHVAGRAARLF